MALKIIYTLFIGILFAALVGVGISAFYESPKYPDYPSRLSVAQKENLSDKEYKDVIVEQEKFDKQQKNTYTGLAVRPARRQFFYDELKHHLAI